MDAEFEVISPINILSENLRPYYWKQLLEGINEAVMTDAESSYDGVIVTHGSDTLSYTSALLGYALSKMDIPVLITAANYPVEDSRSNGVRNFSACVDFVQNSIRSREYIKSGIAPSCPTRGVYTVFENELGDSVVYLSTRLMEAEGYLDTFRGYGNTPLGIMTNGEFIRFDKDINPSIKELCKPVRASDDIQNLNEYVDLSFPNKVMLIQSYPGLDYSQFSFSKDVKAIVLLLYHSSTTCVGEDEYSIARLANICKDRGIDIYLCSYKKLNSRMYASCQEALGSGTTALLNINKEAAYVKCLLAYNQSRVQPQELMQGSLYYEICKQNGA